ACSTWGVFSAACSASRRWSQASPRAVRSIRQRGSRSVSPQPWCSLPHFRWRAHWRDFACRRVSASPRSRRSRIPEAPSIDVRYRSIRECVLERPREWIHNQAHGDIRNLRPHRMTTAPKQPHHVVIVGAGFGGLEAAFGLAGAPVRITLIDRRNHHLFQPLLYQVATASLATSEIAWPI